MDKDKLDNKREFYNDENITTTQQNDNIIKRTLIFFGVFEERYSSGGEDDQDEEEEGVDRSDEEDENEENTKNIKNKDSTKNDKVIVDKRKVRMKRLKSLKFVRPIMSKTPRNPFNQSPLTDHDKICLSFGGCGFLGTYQLGVAHMFVEHGQKLLRRVKRYCGCSSGSLVASILLFSPDRLLEAVEEFYKMADDVNTALLGAITPGFMISDRLKNVCENFVPDDIREADGKVFISVTKVKTWENELIYQFTDKDNYINVLLASCYHPMYSKGLMGNAPTINGESYIDGGYSNMLPEFLDIRTISITAFSGDADICPPDKPFLLPNDFMIDFFNQNVKVTFGNMKRLKTALFPPTRDTLHQYFEAGQFDAEKLLKDANLYE